MSAAQELYITPEEYLERERAAETRSEYFNGRIYAMAGASRAHRLIVANLTAALIDQLRGGPCETYPADARVKVAASAMYTYPDVVVACDPVFEDELDTVLNPRVLIEVLSPSTEAYDRGGKFEHYQLIPSLTDYLLVAQDQPRIEHFRRAGEEWPVTVASGLDSSVRVASLNCELKLAQVYERLSFPESSSTDQQA